MTEYRGPSENRVESGILGERKRHTRKINLTFSNTDLEIAWDMQVGDVWNLSPRARQTWLYGAWL